MHPPEPSDPPVQILSTEAGPIGITSEGAPAANGDAPVVVAFHGYPGSTRDWRWLAPALCPAVRLIRVDMPGFGCTPLQTAPARDLTGRGDFALAVLDALDLPRAVLLSHSLGSSTVLSVAARAPERVSHLALLASPGFRPHWSVPVSRMRAVSRALDNPLGRVALWAPMRGGFTAAGFSKRLREAERTHTFQSAAAMDFDLQRRNAEAVSAPCLVAWAEDDRLVPPDIVEELALALPDGPRLPFPTGGHNIQKTQATELAQALLSWLGVAQP